MIGILDSGVGGLSVMREIVRLLPAEDVIYMADSRNCPYGPRAAEQVRELTRKCVDYLLSEGVDIVVLACNTMTAAAAGFLREHYPQVPIVGMEPAIKPAAAKTVSGVVGVLATGGTLSGEGYHRTKQKYAAGVTVIDVAGRGLVEIVEQRQQQTLEAMELLRAYIEPLLEQGCDTLVLGCTHYPFLQKQIEDIAQGKLQIINPAPAVAKRTWQLMNERGIIKGEKQSCKGEWRFVSTGSKEQQEILEVMALELVGN